MPDTSLAHYRIASSPSRTVCLRGARLHPVQTSRQNAGLFSNLEECWDFTVAMERLVTALVLELETFTAIIPGRILIGNTFSRPGRHHHISYARILAIRLDDKRQPTRPPLFFCGAEYDYVITFCLPRFWGLSYEQKLTTVIHELFHISPEADGNLRRLGRVKYAHGSRARYEERLKPLVEQALTSSLINAQSGFLKYNTHELFKKYPLVRVRPIRISRVKSINVT